jgi:predicted GNAT family acetyltransferase
MIDPLNYEITMTEIIHKPERQAFIISLSPDEGEAQLVEALLEYTLKDNRAIDFRRTYVPFAFRGKGLAEELVQEGLAWAKEQGYTVTASCSYVQKFL